MNIRLWEPAIHRDLCVLCLKIASLKPDISMVMFLRAARHSWLLIKTQCLRNIKWNTNIYKLTHTNLYIQINSEREDGSIVMLCNAQLLGYFHVGTLNPKWRGSFKSHHLGLREFCTSENKKLFKSQRGWRIPRPSKSIGSKHIWTHRDYDNMHRACIGLHKMWS